MPYKSETEAQAAQEAIPAEESGVGSRGLEPELATLAPLRLPVKRHHVPAVAGEVLHPVVHQLTPPLEQVRPRVGGFRPVA